MEEEDTMPENEVDARNFADGFAGQRADQDRTLVAMHVLEAALESAAPGREHGWRDRVDAALQELETVVEVEHANARKPDSLLADLERSHPRLRSRVHGVQAQYGIIRNTLAAIRRELAASTAETPDFADLRQRLSWLLSTLRHQQARESDLLYEAYRDAFGVDVERDSLPLEATDARDESEQMSTKRTDRARSLGALRHVERSAGVASRGREDDWLDGLRASAHELDVMLSHEQSDDGDLFADIERTEPRLHNRVVHLRRQLRDLAAAVRDVRVTLDDSEPDTVDVADLRRTLDQLATELRYLRAREADLVYEAFTVDIGAGD
jgi:hypothetical protein